MREKHLNYLSLSIIITVSIAYFYLATQLRKPIDGSAVGAGYLPIILAFLLVVLSIISIFQTIKRKDEGNKIHLPNALRVFISIVIVMLYIAIWQFIGYYYLISFIFLFSLFMYYQWNLPNRKRRVMENLLISLGLVAFVYIIFEKIMHITL